MSVNIDLSMESFAVMAIADSRQAESALPGSVDGDSYRERKWQGIPTIERAVNGRLWAAFYTGGEEEGPENYVLIVTSPDDGRTWSEPKYVVDPPHYVRAFDPCLWHDPQGRLWLFWVQSFGWFDGRCGVWASVCSDSTVDDPVWAEPRRIADGVMMNKPTVKADGQWLLSIAIWTSVKYPMHDRAELAFSNVYGSLDNGATFELLGSADVPNRHFDEHMIVERRDGSLWMLVRTYYGIGESVSRDGGRTWTPGEPTGLGGPNSRFYVRRLASGKLLLVNHYGFKGRSHLTALLSDDDGLTWKHKLLLDERSDVSYPDGIQAEDGRIYIIYDRSRNKEKELLLAIFTEADIEAGRLVTEGSVLKQLVNKA